MFNFKLTTPHIIFIPMLALAGCSDGGNSGDAPGSGADSLLITQAALVWSPCSDDSVIECAKLKVPVNYAAPGGESMEIALSRISGTGDEARDSLLTNPGGPGSPGSELLEEYIESGALPDALLAAYDVIGFDPRGTGESRPLDCDSDALENTHSYPDTALEIEQNFNAMTSFASACAAKYGDYLQHVGSNAVTKDMNEIRKALGVAKLDFLGYSYGTRLAALYLQQFPTQSGRIILDASMAPEPGAIGLFRESLIPLETNIRNVLAACTQTDPSCDASALFDQLTTRVQALVQQPEDETSELVFGILEFAATEPGLEPLFAGALIPYITDGDLSDLIALSNLIEQETGGDDEFIGDDDAAYTAVICADDPARPTLASTLALLDEFNAESDLLAEAMISEAAVCAGWIESIDPIEVIATNQAPQSLIIGGPSDSSTPLIWSERMAAALGGVFLRSEHDGHTVVFNGENACSDAAAIAFLLDGSLPGDSTCEAD